MCQFRSHNRVLPNEVDFQFCGGIWDRSRGNLAPDQDIPLDQTRSDQRTAKQTVLTGSDRPNLQQHNPKQCLLTRRKSFQQ